MYTKILVRTERPWWERHNFYNFLQNTMRKILISDKQLRCKCRCLSPWLKKHQVYHTIWNGVQLCCFFACQWSGCSSMEQQYHANRIINKGTRPWISKKIPLTDGLQRAGIIKTASTINVPIDIKPWETSKAQNRYQQIHQHTQMCLNYYHIQNFVNYQVQKVSIFTRYQYA